MTKEVSKKKSIKTPINKKFEDRANLSKLALYICVVNHGQSHNIIRLMESIGCSASFVQQGRGTAPQAVKDILNIIDNKKEVVISIVRESRLDEIQKEVNAYFLSAKKNKGIGFAIPMNTIVGIRIYKFLSQTL